MTSGRLFCRLGKEIPLSPEAIQLIHNFRPYVVRWSRRLDRHYPGEDWEAAGYAALYNAACTYNESSTFIHWLALHLTSVFTGKTKSQARKDARLRRIPWHWVEDNLYYEDRTPREI